MRKVKKAMRALLKKYPFFGSLAFRMEIVMDGEKCRTAGTNMKQIILNPDFVEKLSDEELEFILCHEIMHCVLEHCVRGKKYDKKLHNVACDLVINSILLGVMGLESFKVDGEPVIHLAPGGVEARIYTTDELYKILEKRIKGRSPSGEGEDDSDGEGQSESESSFDDHDIWDGIKPVDGIILTALLNGVLKEMSQTSRGLAIMPAEVRKVVLDKNYRTKLDWQQLLTDFAEIETEKQTYSFRRPNRRFLHKDEIRVSRLKVKENKKKEVDFFVDTSGSVDKEMLRRELSEIYQAVKQVEELKGRLYCFDTRVTEPVEFDSVESLNEFVPEGGGGTSFEAIFHYVQGNLETRRPNAIVIVTDGEAYFPKMEEAAGIPVMWVFTKPVRCEPGWGKVVYM